MRIRRQGMCDIQPAENNADSHMNAWAPLSHSYSCGWAKGRQARAFSSHIELESLLLLSIQKEGMIPPPRA